MAWFGNAGDDLPWGWWLRSSNGMFEDEEGRRWVTVRAAFWEGHLGFPESHVADEQLEMLLRMLAMLDREARSGRETVRDIFGGDMLFWRFYMCWLRSVGLLEVGYRIGVFEGPLSKLGRSVLRMLQATRDPEWATLPFAAVAAAVGSASGAPADAAREAALAAFEREAAHLPYVFAREKVHASHVVTLTGFGAGARMPTRRVMWSQTFPDARSRDDFFAWLAERVDRWEDWGKMAYSVGAAGLTQHLMALFVISRPEMPA